MNSSFRRGGTRAALGFAIALALACSPVYARSTLPQNLGYGLDKLVESQLIIEAAQGRQIELYDGWATEAAAEYAGRAIRDPNDANRFLVDITLSGKVGFDALRSALEARFQTLSIQAVDKSYRGVGIIEGYISIDEVAALAQTKGVKGVFLGLKPELDSVPTEVADQLLPSGGAQAAAKDAATPDGGGPVVLNKLGSAFDQGVTQHRVDKINQFYNPAAPVNWTGSGITIGALSDSYDTRGTAPTAATSVANFDLPGAAGHPTGNTQPVAIIQDLPAVGTDEGRGMLEILHKMAPNARLGFATGSLGEVEFGNSIRTLAGLPGFEFTPPQGGVFKADVIVDDISYGGEPFYGETIIGNAIDDVTAAGVSYFSSAGNNIGINAYESTLRIVPNGTGLTAATNSALVGTNIDLTGVPANLYAGGFHNFNPIPGQLDVAQLVNMPNNTNASTEMQWNDPYDQRELVLNNPPIFSASGSIPVTTNTVTYDGSSTPALPVFAAGVPHVITVTQTGGDFDAIVDVIDPLGNLLLSQDTGIDELVTFYPPTGGQYRIVVKAFSPTTGTFDITVNTASGQAGVTTDLNLLVFRADTGAFIAARSLTANNLASNRPVELGVVRSAAGQSQSQFLIARANIPPANQIRPTVVRWSTRGNGAGGIGPAEYFTYNATTTKGHATAKGCNGTAAYSVFRTSFPETFTSPGTATIYFDKDANRLATPEVRQVPRVAAADAANTGSFGGDSTADPDTNPNFSGTSAAAPHAAALAALVLESRGGVGSVTPAAMRTILQQNVFPHDLDPSFASGTAVASDGGGVVITISSDGNRNALTGENDVNSIQVTYLGPGSLASLNFNPTGSPALGGAVSTGVNGVSDNVGSNPPTVNYFDFVYPGMIFGPAAIKPFTLGTLTGITPADVVTPLNVAPFTGFSNPAGLPSPANIFYSMSLTFPTQAFTDGDVLRFTVGRGAQRSSSVAGGTGPTNGATSIQPIADLFGGGVILPTGVVVEDGMQFTGTTTSGATFTGRIRNRVGVGFSNVDGYGFIDAVKATAGDALFSNGFEDPN